MSIHRIEDAIARQPDSPSDVKLIDLAGGYTAKNDLFDDWRTDARFSYSAASGNTALTDIWRECSQALEDEGYGLNHGLPTSRKAGLFRYTDDERLSVYRLLQTAVNGTNPQFLRDPQAFAHPDMREASGENTYVGKRLQDITALHLFQKALCDQFEAHTGHAVNPRAIAPVRQELKSKFLDDPHPVGGIAEKILAVDKLLGTRTRMLAEDMNHTLGGVIFSHQNTVDLPRRGR